MLGKTEIACELCEKHFSKLKGKKSIEESLLSLNVFLYTYFLVKCDLNLNRVLENMTEKIRSCIDEKDYDTVSKELINTYFKESLKKNKKTRKDVVGKAQDFIEENFDSKITLGQLSKELYVSRNYLCSMFKEKTGMSFCQYLNSVRINRAKELLKEDKKTLEYISFCCGYSSQSHFSKVFKKNVGMSPNRFKKQIKNASGK